ncbi:MAG TPA: Hsp20/alpha crystallin family protein [Thermoanaerobaculia bacterium]|nr:Hsp20/alpha crystallin family protein [Thermoanaerobaculia bacterium]
MNLLTRFDRWEPFEELTTLKNRMDRMLSRFTEEGEEPLLTARWAPVSDIFETGDAFIVKAELPGIEEKDITVEIEGNVLTLQGERKLETETEEKGYRRMERSYGKFLRSFTLPQNVKPEKITAAFVNGILEVTVPKKEESKPRKISVELKKKLVSAA